jgi:hypothetical protein
MDTHGENSLPAPEEAPVDGVQIRTIRLALGMQTFLLLRQAQCALWAYSPDIDMPTYADTVEWLLRSWASACGLANPNDGDAEGKGVNVGS